MDFFKPFLVTLIPLMVALDAPGTLPLYVGMTEGVTPADRKKIVGKSPGSARTSKQLALYFSTK